MFGEKDFKVGAVLATVTVMLFSGFGTLAYSEEAREAASIPAVLPRDSTIFVNGYVFDCLASEPAFSPSLMAQPAGPDDRGFYILHMTGPVRQEWADAVTDMGIDIVNYVPNYAYQVRMTPVQRSMASELPFIDWIGAYHPAYKISQEISGSEVTVTLVGDDIAKATLDDVRSLMSVFREGATTSGYILHGRVRSDDAIAAIASIPDVQFISTYKENKLMDEAGSQIIGGFMWYNDPDSNVNTPYRTTGTHGAYVNHLGYDGAGITVGIADTGLGTGATPNAGHNDFTGRVLTGMSYDAGGWQDGHGHGTHCAGLMAADTFEGNGVIYAGFGPYYVAEGLAHESSIYAQKIFSDTGGWIGPTDVGDILADGYAGGARIHSNSWGAGTYGAYDDNDQAYDIRTRDADDGTAGNQQILAVVAASNDGPATGSTGSPGNGKNVLTIGASVNYMPDSMSYGNTDENGNNPDAIASFSSRGWTDDGRVKPDVCAPGQATLSLRSPNELSDNLFGFYTPDTRYQWCSGTSQATPTAAGAATVVYQWYEDIYGAYPTPAMTKALLINQAVDMATADIPNQNEGWGRVYVPSIVDPLAPFLVYDAPTELTTGTYNEYQFSYGDNSQPLKITLVWTDKNAITGDAVTLKNDLRLQLTAPLGQAYNGNAFVNGWTPAATNPSATFDTNADGNDDRNNVECIYIPAGQLQTGLYTLRVSGFNVPADCDNDGSNDQDYSLVISNALDVTSKGTIDIQNPRYTREASVQVTVKDADLNINTGVQTTSVPIVSAAEPTGEFMTLTETAGDTGIFIGSITISATNGAGILWVNAADVITATYNDADDGTGSPAVVSDTAIVDGTPPGAPTGLTVEWYGLVEAPIYTETFEGDGTPTFAELGWTTGGASNDWQVADPAGLGTPADPANAYQGTFSMGNDLTGLGTYPGEYENGIAVDSNYIYSPAIDCTGYTSVQVSYARWLGIETSTYDHVYVEAARSPTGPWTQIWTNSATMAETAWTVVTHDIGAVADSQTAVYVRFELGSTDGSDTWCGWNIDNFALVGMTAGTQHNTLNWTLSSDDGAGANDVSGYNIYRSSVQAGPWDATTLIGTVGSGIATYVDADRGEFDGTNWWYVVRAEDDLGNEDANTNAVPEIPTSNVAPSAPTNPTPANGATGVSVNPTLSVRAADPNGDPMTVRFYNAAGPTLIGTNTNVPSGTYTNMAWPGRLPMTAYSWYATADDGEFVTGSATWSFTTMDTTPPGPPSGLTVEWTGTSSATLIDQDFSDATFPPTGWAEMDPTADWNRVASASAGGVSPEAVFSWYDGVDVWRLYAGPLDTTGMSNLALSWNNFYDDWGAGVTVKVQTSSDATTWHDTSWVVASGSGNVGPGLETLVVNTADVGSATFYLGFTVDGDAYQLDYWYIDDVLLTYTGGSTTDDNLLKWTLSADDGAGTDDVAQYNIYRALASSGPWDSGALIDTVPAGTGTYTDAGRGEVDGINWWYVVRAEDIWGNEETNSVAVPESGVAPPPYAISLAGKTAGSWVFVSYPSGLTGDISTLLDDSVLGDGLTTWDVAKWFNPQTPNDPWKTYRVSGTANDMPTVTNAMGFWIHLTANGGDQLLTLSSYAATPASTIITLYAGWNLVGYPSLTDASGSTTPAAVTIISVYSVSAAYTDYVAKASATLHHGNAYFMYATAGTTWTVTNP